MGFFKVKAKNKLSEMEIGSRIEESDFVSLTPDGSFVQLEYVDEDKEREPYKCKPGIWTIKKSFQGMFLERTEFVKDKVLSDFVHTKNVTEKIDKFFAKLHVYRDHGIEVPKRGILLFGPPGTGKTTILNKVSNQYSQDGKTAIVVWTTDAYESYDVKEFIKSFHYEGVEKLVLIAEDIGGVEVDQVRMKSDPSLLALLDNKEKTFKIPTLILATTNFPEIFLGNLTNRPDRFDDKIEVAYPSGEYRSALLKFFARIPITESDSKLIESSKCAKFSPAHIREVVLRAAIYDKTIQEVIDEINSEITYYETAFTKKKNLGMGV